MTTEALMDILWILLCSGFVFLMQGGFLCLESGVTRTKNSINVAVKNMVDFGLAVLLYWLVSYGIMFGASKGGWFGSSGWFFQTDDSFQYSVFIFQAMFCATGATIISGATAERLRFYAYIFITIVFSVLVYPFVGHWVWATNALGDPAGWLLSRGFMDFAGSSVVHSTGGWVALALLIIIGPRMGRFTDGKSVEIPGSNLPLAMLGATLLVFGWFGFNGGSTLSFNESVPLILMNTLMGAVAGMITVLMVTPFQKTLPDPGMLMNGAIAGLVAVTANCNVTGPIAAMIIGLIGGGIMMATVKLLEYLKIDDAVGAIPAHLTPGIWGTLAVAFFADPEVMGVESINRGELFTTQLIGVVVIGFWSFCLSFVFFWLINKAYPFRVSEEEEFIGLNVSEHGARTETVFLLQEMEAHARSGDLSKRVYVEPFTEIGQIARQYNKVIDTLDLTISRLKSIFHDLNDGLITFGKDGNLLEMNAAAARFFGLEPAMADGMSAWDLLVPEAREDLEVHQRANEEPFDPFRTGVMQELHYFRPNSRKDEVVEFVASKGVYEEEEIYTGLIRDISDTVQVKRNRSRLVNKLFGAQQSSFYALMCRQSLPVAQNLAERIRRVAKAPKADLSNPDHVSNRFKLILQDAEDIVQVSEELQYADEHGGLKTTAVPAAPYLKEQIQDLVASSSHAALREVPIELDIAQSSFQIQVANTPFSQSLEALLLLAAYECPEGQQVSVKAQPMYLDHDRVGTEVVPEGEYMLITIHDGGRGLADGQLDEYYSGREREYPEIELANADLILRSHGGVLDVDSMPGLGTTQRIYLPVHRPLEDPGSPESGKATILVVDDFPLQRRQLEALFHHAGYEVLHCSSEEEASRLLSAHQVDAVVLDLVLARDQGPSDHLFQYIRKEHPALPIVACSGETDPEILAVVVEQGASAYIRKPLVYDSLLHMVNRELAVR